uniref:Uncharacterized protein n=1 Tax=Gallus gallus TaxID=9031 RepID=A0A8V0ZDZ8_CHICK
RCYQLCLVPTSIWEPLLGQCEETLLAFKSDAYIVQATKSGEGKSMPLTCTSRYQFYTLRLIHTCFNGYSKKGSCPTHS